ncbi:MAG: CoA transferase [Gammaproteobacteria bacterium]|nr:CoA transferase [Gammaproteobacteria bacterium]
MEAVLDGVRVIDFCRYIAGPFCTALLADLGAEVIRIEKVDGSEDRYVSPITDDGVGAAFMQMNRNKKSVTLNPMRPEGREIVRKLVATADVVAANLPPPTLEAMGIDYDSLREIKPDIILTTMNAFGSGGPYSERVGFDGVGQVMSGGVYLGGTPDQPIKSFTPYADYGTASLSCVGTLAALMHRNKTGEGQIVEGALLRTALAFNNPGIIEQAAIAVNRVGSLNRGQNAGPSDIFKTKDGWVIAQVIGQPLFERWARLMGENYWLVDERFKDDISRGNNGTVISERMSQWTAERTTDEVLSQMAEARIPCGPVLSPEDAPKDPHVQAVGFLKDVEYPGLEKPVPVSEFPVRLSKTPGEIRHHAPTLGEHTDEVLGSLGYSPEQIDAFRAKRVC